VERVIASATLPLSPSGALQRVFEAIACGALLPGGPGILDPCERTPTDAAESLTSQEREDITASAQVVAYYLVLTFPGLLLCETMNIATKYRLNIFMFIRF